MMILTFPLEQIALVLRKLSLSGTIGNMIAIIFYILFCLIPVFAFFYLRQRGKREKIDRFLFLLSAVLFVVVYLMINPGYLGNMGNLELGGSIILCGTFYSAAFSYLVLRLLERFRQADLNGLLKNMNAILHILMAAFGGIILFQLVFVLPENIQNLQKMNTMTGVDLRATYVFLVFRSIVNVFPYLTDIGIAYCGSRVLKETMADRYSDTTIAATRRLADKSMMMLKLTILVSLGFNILQAMFCKHLYQVDVTVLIPVFSIAFIMASLILARYVQENQKLKQDNDLFI